MHEMALTEGVVRVLEEQARVNGYSRVKTVRLEIGALSHVAPHALAFCYEAVARGTLAEGSRLEIVSIPGSAWCATCSAAVAIARRYDPCPHCGGHQLRITGGAEMRIKELEVE
jgi:hydrogenase nickel incorporation protein HypA/HybF